MLRAYTGGFQCGFHCGFSAGTAVPRLEAEMVGVGLKTHHHRSAAVNIL